MRCPEETWRPWLPLVLRFGAEATVQRVRRHVAPIPPVVELVTSRSRDDAFALGDLAEYLHVRGEVGRLTTKRSGLALPKCDVFLLPRARAVAWLEDFVQIEQRHTARSEAERDDAARRRFAKLPRRGDQEDDARTLWAVVVPPSEIDDDDDDANVVPDPTPAAQLGHILEITSALARNTRNRPTPAHPPGGGSDTTD